MFVFVNVVLRSVGIVVLMIAIIRIFKIFESVVNDSVVDVLSVVDVFFSCEMMVGIIDNKGFVVVCVMLKCIVVVFRVMSVVCDVVTFLD